MFRGGTPILTPDGELPIEQFRTGDWVLASSEHFSDAPLVPRQVEAVFRSRAAVISLKIGERTIRTTAKHPFWVRGRGWTAASDLIEGDQLRSHDGQWIRLSGSSIDGEFTNVYNIRVASDHTYFVGAKDWGFSIWAHNECTVDTTQRNGQPLAPGENVPFAYDPNTDTIFVGAQDQNHQGVIAGAGLDPNTCGAGSILNNPYGNRNGTTILNGGSPSNGGVGIPPDNIPGAQNSLETWIGNILTWINKGMWD